MKKQRKMKPYSLLFVLFLSHFSIAQQTAAQLEKVTEKNFYRIRVSPEIRSASKTNLGDLRIFNSTKKEVPYLIDTQPQKTEVSQFEAFTIVSKNSVAKKYSSVTIENPKNQINQLTLVVANSDVRKKYTISGSTDQKQWFGIANTMELSDLNDVNSTQVSKTISFPLCTYKFIKITFDDTKTLPINILQVGTTTNNLQFSELEEIKIKDRFIIQLPKEKKTQHQLFLNYPLNIDKIIFKIKEPKLFNRNVTIYTIQTKTVHNKTNSNKEIIATFTLSSNSKNEFAISSRKSNKFFIEIANEDNPELEIESITLYQKPLFIIAQLNPNEAYTVATGDANLATPSYDLVYFENEMKNVTTEIKMTSIQQKDTTKKVAVAKSFWQQPWFMWLCIIVAGSTILYFSIGLAKDMKNN